MLSAGAHLLLVIALLVGAVVWRATKPKVYVVNLVPTVAAVGSQQGRPTPDLPPRTADLPAARTTPRELPTRDLPPPSREAMLPDRALPPPTSTALRASDKELPTMPSAPAPRVSPRPATTAPPPLPAVPLGQVSGSPQGAGAVTLNVSDFPYAWYIQAIHRKIQERWEGRAIPGRQPEVVFDIMRNGQISKLNIGKSSGNPTYDLVAQRAISEAGPFPELPREFQLAALTVHLQFVYDASTR